MKKEYNKLMGEWHELSKIDRAKSDLKYAQAQEIMDRLEELSER